MNCEICRQNIDLQDYMSPLLGSQLKIDQLLLQNQLCQLCFNRINLYLDHSIQQQFNIQQQCIKQLQKIDSNQVVQFSSYSQDSYVVEQEIDNVTIVEVPVQIQNMNADYLKTDNIIQQQTNQVLLTPSQLFPIPVQPQTFIELNALIHQFALLLIYHEVPGISPVLPAPLVQIGVNIIPVYFQQRSSNKLRKKQIEQEAESTQQAVQGFKYMIQQTHQLLNLSYQDIFISELDLWQKWDTTYIKLFYSLVKKLSEKQ
ncbi:hypothetical protein SS50377_23203 [Spironucleus salmonicida]|uniref:Uncharacterized protein n=1 Tax=Spironucleus salmonicida TaxID=348837 RepID=V6LNY0_9EUKA|nr:hypothetical protein SS50377_23203 [Spironucleus salmonicida]|eukprot:EST46305.1 Hypothetical protein SS50377_13692 [Spironucleus salmonicida]